MNKGLQERLITAIFFVAAVLALLLYASWTAQALLFIIMFFMLYEYFQTVFAGDPGIFAKLFTGILGSIIFSSVYVYKYDYNQFLPWLFGVLGVHILANLYIIFTKKSSSLRIPPYYLQAFIFICLPITVGLAFLYDSDSFRYVILAIFLLLWTNDAFAYLIGSQIGRTKIAPKISPGKSWEGAIGGFIFLSIVSYLLTLIPVFQMYSWGQWAIIAGLASFFGTVGDFLESAFKRHFKIKDSGTIFPGHGGFLDRFDSFIFALPVILLVIKYIL